MAVLLGAAYLGVIFAPSARRVTIEQARDVFGADGARQVQRVGVFANASLDDIVGAVERLSLDVVQLHDTGVAALADDIIRRVTVRLWTVLHVGSDGVAEALRRHPVTNGDGVLLDAHVDGMLGGTGQSFDWESGRAAIDALRSRRPIILAGGLRPENVARAIALVEPNVVDVSSGVESSPGVKDHSRMRAFAAAVQSVE